MAGEHRQTARPGAWSFRGLVRPHLCFLWSGVSLGQVQPAEAAGERDQGGLGRGAGLPEQVLPDGSAPCRGRGRGRRRWPGMSAPLASRQATSASRRVRWKLSARASLSITGGASGSLTSTATLPAPSGSRRQAGVSVTRRAGRREGALQVEADRCDAAIAVAGRNARDARAQRVGQLRGCRHQAVGAEREAIGGSEQGLRACIQEARPRRRVAHQRGDGEAVQQALQAPAPAVGGAHPRLHLERHGDVRQQRLERSGVGRVVSAGIGRPARY